MSAAAPGALPTPSRAAAEDPADLPSWRAVLVVVAHPDDESFGLGAVVESFVARGAAVDALCFTRGEASTLGAAPDLAAVRERELHDAADALGIRSVTLLDFPDGELGRLAPEVLVDRVAESAAAAGADGLLVFDSNGVTGHPDHVAATAAAVRAAQPMGLGVLAWCLPAGVAERLDEEFGAGFQGRSAPEIDLRVTVTRTRQRVAVSCHPSQVVPGGPLWRRLELQGPFEHLRWLRPAASS